MKKFARIGSVGRALGGGAPWMSPIRGIRTAPETNHAPTAKASDASATRVRRSTTRNITGANAARPSNSSAQPAGPASRLAPSIRSNIPAGAVTGKPKAGAN